MLYMCFDVVAGMIFARKRVKFSSYTIYNGAYMERAWPFGRAFKGHVFKKMGNAVYPLRLEPASRPHHDEYGDALDTFHGHADESEIVTKGRFEKVVGHKAKSKKLIVSKRKTSHNREVPSGTSQEGCMY